MTRKTTKAPRIYGAYDLKIGNTVPLTDDHCHYLLSVMRREDGDVVRVFNGTDGEFLGEIAKTGKKNASLNITEQLREQCETSRKVHLYFAPIKKDRLGFLIEKVVELGVTDLHPILTAHTENRKFNPEKVHKQMIEASEQCERLDIPTLHDVCSLADLIDVSVPIYAALERCEATIFMPTAGDVVCLIGPEGGWHGDEITFLQGLDNVTPVSLGNNILRAETAAMFMLSRISQ